MSQKAVAYLFGKTQSSIAEIYNELYEMSDMLNIINL